MQLPFGNWYNKMIEKLICTLPDQAKIHPFISILNIGHCLKYLPKGCLYLFMLSVFYIMQPFLWAEGSKLPISDFLLIEILRLANVGKSKQSSFTRDLASSRIYEPIEGNTGIGSFMPTSKCSLPVSLGPDFFLLLIVHPALSNGA